MEKIILQTGANRTEEGRTDLSDVIVKFNGEEYTVAKQSCYNGRDRDTLDIKWDIDELERLFGKKLAKRIGIDSRVNSGTPESDWYEPLSFLEDKLRELGELQFA